MSFNITVKLDQVAIIISHDPESGWYWAESLSLPGLFVAHPDKDLVIKEATEVAKIMLRIKNNS